MLLSVMIHLTIMEYDMKYLPCGIEVTFETEVFDINNELIAFIGYIKHAFALYYLTNYLEVLKV